MVLKVQIPRPQVVLNGEAMYTDKLTISTICHNNILTELAIQKKIVG